VDLVFRRCDAVNSATLTSSPASTSVRFSVFFPPTSLDVKLERPTARKEGDERRAETFKRAKKFEDDTYRVVVAGEHVRLACVAGKSLASLIVFCRSLTLALLN